MKVVVCGEKFVAVVDKKFKLIKLISGSAKDLLQGICEGCPSLKVEELSEEELMLRYKL